MNTWVLCFRRLKAFECTMRSRSRWNAVRIGWRGSSRSRPLVSAERVARSARIARSSSSSRSRIPPTRLRLAPAPDATSEMSLSEHPVVEVGERLAGVAAEPGGLALGGRVPRGGGVPLDAEVPGHPLDPEVVPRIGDQEGTVETRGLHAPGGRRQALERARALGRHLDDVGGHS